MQLGLYFLFYRVVSVLNTRRILGQELAEGSPARLAICTGPAAMVELWRSFETLASAVESAAADLIESGICATYSRVGAESGSMLAISGLVFDLHTATLLALWGGKASHAQQQAEEKRIS